MFEVVWGAMVACGIAAIGGHLVATQELRDEAPRSAGLGWFGPGPTSKRGRTGYFIKRLFTVLALVAAGIAIAVGGPSAP